MTPDDIDNLEALLAAAEPEPMTCRADLVACETCQELAITTLLMGRGECGVIDGWNHEATAALIAALVNAAPELIRLARIGHAAERFGKANAIYCVGAPSEEQIGEYHAAELALLRMTGGVP
jgi:hypothetical protein